MTPRVRTLALAAVGAVAVSLLGRNRVPPAREQPVHVEESKASPPAPALEAPPAAPVTAVSGSAEAPRRPETESEFMRELMHLESTDKEAALALARKGEAWYSSSGKAAEARKAMIVTLLADLNRMDEARALARGFMAAFPGSEYLPLVQGATGIHPRPHGPSGIVY
jgi:hypothetical protein